MNKPSLAAVLLALAAAALAASAGAQTTFTESVLHNFAGADAQKGANPASAPVRDSAGNLYGTATSGGAWNQGVVFKIDPAGDLTVLHSFTGGSDGGLPTGDLLRDASGNLFGVTLNGGNPCTGFYSTCGLVYEMDTAGRETVLFAFNSGDSGFWPSGGLARDAAGNLYGTTSGGGSAHGGVVFKLDPAGNETVLHAFRGGSDGDDPVGGVVLDSGFLYGATTCGGTGSNDICGGGGGGTVFKLDSSGHETILYNFAGGSDGLSPESGVILDSAGNIYGTTNFGGTSNEGVVYKLNPAGQETMLFSFPGGDQGGYPAAAVLLDPQGNLYGTTYGEAQGGVVFKLDPSGVETVLHIFKGGADGANPNGIYRDAAGNIFGTTYQGGASNLGTVYELASGHETILYSFRAGTGGAFPPAGVARDSSGNLYGVAKFGGSANDGIVFKYDATGRYSVLYNFPGGSNGATPYAGVTLDAAGNLYGTTYYGGSAANAGVIYKLTSAGQESVLYAFTGGDDGANPTGGVTLDAAGNLYGTATTKGSSDCGVLFKLDTSGAYTALHTFAGAYGCNPEAAPVFDSAANLYGTTSSGAIYKYDTAGNYTVLHDDGSDLNSGVTLDPAGNIYGEAYLLPKSWCNHIVKGCNWLYKLDPAGNFSVLHTFTGRSDGYLPSGGLTIDSAGNLYGATIGGGSAGGHDGHGVVFEVDTAGTYTVLHTFTGLDGSGPYGGVTLDPQGNLYGTTYNGGKTTDGVLFELSRQ